MYLYRISRWFYLHKFSLIAKILKGINRIVWGCVLPPSAEIGKNTVITYHGLGVVIHKNAIIGNDCIIRQNVTIAGATVKGITGAPKIGNNVELNTGCVVLGPITIGNNVRIGANAVVNTDIPDNCTAVGLPAKPIRHYDSKDFHIGV